MLMLIEALAKLGLDKLNRALTFGGVLVAVLAVSSGAVKLDHNWFSFLFRWMHVIAGIMWIGLLWYFNFVQIPSMPKIPDEQKPAIGKVIAPAALFWFRWAALATVVTGLIVISMKGVGALKDAMLLGYLQGGYFTYIGIGMWLGLIMAFNVWNIIWPNQKIALGMKEADADAKAKAAKTAMQFSRINTLLSIPMLVTMTMNQTMFG